MTPWMEHLRLRGSGSKPPAPAPPGENTITIANTNAPVGLEGQVATFWYLQPRPPAPGWLRVLRGRRKRRRRGTTGNANTNTDSTVTPISQRGRIQPRRPNSDGSRVAGEGSQVGSHSEWKRFYDWVMEVFHWMDEIIRSLPSFFSSFMEPKKLVKDLDSWVCFVIFIRCFLSRFERVMRRKGYSIKPMGEDGACLFRWDQNKSIWYLVFLTSMPRAVADQLYGDQEMHHCVRAQCMDYIVSYIVT